MKLSLKERESLLDKLIVWILGTPGKEKERLKGLYKQANFTKQDKEYIDKQIMKYPDLRDKYNM